jgi:hypothetical protein
MNTNKERKQLLKKIIHDNLVKDIIARVAHLESMERQV